MKHVLKWFDKFVLGLALVALLVSLGVCLYYRITHPDATDFRCFLETWPFAVLAMTSFFYLVYRTKQNGW